MKGRDTMKTAVWIPAVLLLVLTAGIVQAVEKSPAVLLQEAMYQEEKPYLQPLPLVLRDRIDNKPLSGSRPIGMIATRWLDIRGVASSIC